MSKTIVLKFGGASLATPLHFDNVVDIVLEEKKQVDQVVVVVSAMGKTTDELFSLARKVHPEPPQREMDMLISVGERISMSLLAMAFAKRNVNAVSFTGSQAGIITTSEHSNAKIVDVRPHRLKKSLTDKKLVIVAGFQGVSIEGEITTLGRGGSDTTAVALAVALSSQSVTFYKDVAGFYEKDPKQDPESTLFSSISYENAIALSEQGAKVMHTRALTLAKQNGMKLQIKSFLQELRHVPGTSIEGAPADSLTFESAV